MEYNVSIRMSMTLKRKLRDEFDPYNKVEGPKWLFCLIVINRQKEELRFESLHG